MTDSAKETARGAIESVRKAISKFWDRFRKLFDFSRVSAERVADKALLDLLDSVNPNMLIDRYARPEGVRTDTESAPAESAEERNEEPHTDDAEESSLSGDDIEGQTVTDEDAREKGILDALVAIMKKAGLKVYVNASKGQSVLNRENREGRRVRTLSAKKRRVLETASLGNNPRSLTVVSSTHGTKVLNNLDNLADKLKKSKTQPKIFIGELAKALEASSKGSGSQYATFETKNGQIVTIRISNHNASAERMDTAGRSNAISIVISPKQNHSISNNGDAHIIEFYYSPIKLRKATGKPLAEIVGSVKQALYSGEYKDTTGLAEVQEVNEDTVREYGIRFFRNKDGEVYGFVLDGEIYLDPKVANSETAIHEYTHLWADALRRKNSEEWKNVVSLMKGTSLWEEIKKSYPELEADFLGIHFTTADEVADRVLGDLLSGVNPVEAMGDKADTERAEESGKETARKDSSVDAEDEGSDRTEAASERAEKNDDKAGGKSKVLERMREIASGLLSRIANSDFTGYETLPERIDNESAPAEPAEERNEEPHTDDAEESSLSGDDIEGQTVADDAARKKGILDALVTIMRKAGLKVHVNAGKGQSVLNRENREGRRVRAQVQTSEEKEIIEKARKDGTYMKAPNGEPTNLTERQWMQVRTKAFKKWFGDWEKAALRNALLNGKAVTTLTGNEFGKDEVRLTDKVPAYYQENYGGKVTRDGLGEVLLDKESVKDSISHGIGRTKSAAFAAVPEIITQGLIIDSRNNWKGRNYDSVTIAAPVTINSERYIGVVVVKRLPNSKNRFYLHEVILQEKLLGDNIKTDTKAGYHQGDVANVVKNIVNASEDVSKFVDENGEPKVFYHNTDAEVTIFDSALNGSHTDAGWLGDGFYFYGNEMEGNGYGKNKIAVFLNVRDPYYATSEENERLAELNDRDASIEFREDVESEGYDGVYYNGDLRQEAVVFSPNQIKSATDNIGTFSTENDDIRFFRDKYDEIYGFVLDGEIYLDPKVADSETAIHEYTHLWADALRKLNPEEWKNIVSLMKGTSLWEEIKKSYPELEADFLGIHFTTADEVADRVLGDLLNGVNPIEAMGDKADTERAEESGKETAREDSSVDAEDEGSDRTEASTERTLEIASGLLSRIENSESSDDALLSRIANSDFTGYETLPEDVKNVLSKRAKEILASLKKKEEQNRKAEEDRHIEGNGTYSDALKRIRSVKNGNDAVLKRVLDVDFSDFPELSENEKFALFAEAMEKARNLQTDDNDLAKTEDEDREEQHMRRDGQLPAPDRQKKSKVGGTRHDGRCTRAVCFCAYVEKFKTRLLEIPLSDEAYNWLPAKPVTARPTDKVSHPATPTPR